MSEQYDLYLQEHKENVAKAFHWLRLKLPHLLVGYYDYEWQICMAHDHSKDKEDEYDAYDAYFYGEKTEEVKQNFSKAWLLHIHRNPHHWQHWILRNDDPTKEETLIPMDYPYILEMICDWWSFSWKSGELTELLTWYYEHKDIKLHPDTKKVVERILKDIKEKLESEEIENV